MSRPSYTEERIKCLPISNIMLDSCGTELLVRRKLTFSCIYELSLSFALFLIFFPPPVAEGVQYFISQEIIFSSFSPVVGLLFCWFFDFCFLNLGSDDQAFLPSAFLAL